MFTLLNAFYGGALTMFFALQPIAHFSNGGEALSAYPEWSIKFIESFEKAFIKDTYVFANEYYNENAILDNIGKTK